MGIHTKVVPVEAYDSIRIVKRYYSLLRRVYLIITKELSDLAKDIAVTKLPNRSKQT